jgi:hypothetical protein
MTTRPDLTRLLTPQSIAIIGASTNLSSISRRPPHDMAALAIAARRMAQPVARDCIAAEACEIHACAHTHHSAQKHFQFVHAAYHWLTYVTD